MLPLKQGWVSSRCIILSKHGLLAGGQQGVESVINWSAGPVWLNGSLLWAGQRRAGGSGPDWWAAHLNKPASGCQGQPPGGYRGRGVCRRAAAPEGPEEQKDKKKTKLLWLVNYNIYSVASYSRHTWNNAKTNSQTTGSKCDRLSTF